MLSPINRAQQVVGGVELLMLRNPRTRRLLLSDIRIFSLQCVQFRLIPAPIYSELASVRLEYANSNVYSIFASAVSYGSLCDYVSSGN